MDDFLFDERIIISPYEQSYQQLYEESALAITDYSSAIFDFAYLKKPVIYYQFDVNHWDIGYFDYNTMGFGEVKNSVDDVVSLIIKHMKKGCIMEKKYKERVDDFYAYNDCGNCGRVYKDITSME